MRDAGWPIDPADRFVLARLEAGGLHPVRQASPLEWLRRASFDLTGLPPTPEQVAAFTPSDGTGVPESRYTRQVDDWLASPAFGQRWARHWLDVARFAESAGKERNHLFPEAWRYRDWVVDAFNADMPFDFFLLRQIAGDLLPPSGDAATDAASTIATGFLMVGPKALAETDKEQSRLDIVDDQIDVTGRAMLGLTLACARCHDHKFDAVRATDYYAMAGIFRSTEPFQNEVRNATMWWEFPIPQEAGVEPIMVMAPKETQPRNLRVHLRGNRFTLGKVVPRGPLWIVAATATESDRKPIIDPHQMSSGRLELARWIASPSNPWTARVLVKRVWQLHF
ncbi:MAG: DUF1549 domain-containing protein, partial [Verrucomicrobiota bacterium]